MSERNEKSFSEVLDLVRKQHVAMLTTHDGERLVSRPMGMQAPDDDGTLWFFCHTSSDVASQVQTNSGVNVALADGDYLSLSGTAEVVHDPAKNRDLWGPFVETWMQCKPEDPECSLIKVTPESIGYWDTPGAIGSMIAMVGGMITKKEPDVGESGVVETPGA